MFRYYQQASQAPVRDYDPSKYSSNSGAARNSYLQPMQRSNIVFSYENTYHPPTKPQLRQARDHLRNDLTIDDYDEKPYARKGGHNPFSDNRLFYNDSELPKYDPKMVKHVPFRESDTVFTAGWQQEQSPLEQKEIQRKQELAKIKFTNSNIYTAEQREFADFKTRNYQDPKTIDYSRLWNNEYGPQFDSEERPVCYGKKKFLKKDNLRYGDF